MNNNENVNLIKCPKCNCTLDAKALFCSTCGSKVVVEKISPSSTYEGTNLAHRFCNKCGFKNEFTANSCNNCGNVFDVPTNGAVKTKIPTPDLHNIKFPFNFKMPINTKLMAISLFFIVIVLGFFIYNSSVSSRLDYILLNTQKQLNKELIESYEATDVVDNISNLLQKDYEMKIDVDSETAILVMKKGGKKYSYTLSDDYDKINFDYTLDKNTLDGSIAANNDDIKVSYNLVYDKKSDELEVLIIVEEATVSNKVTIIITEPALKIIDGKLVLTDVYEDLKKDYNVKLLELFLASEIENVKSKEKGVDREITLEFDMEEYYKITFEYYEELANILIQDVRNIKIETDDSYGDYYSKQLSAEFEAILDDAIEDLKSSTSLPSSNIDLLLKTKNGKIKGFEIEDFTFMFENTKSYLNNKATFNYADRTSYEVEGTVVFSFDKKVWAIDFEVVEEDDSAYSCEFSWNLKSGEGSISFYSNGSEFEESIDFIIFADKKSAELGYSDEYIDISIQIDAK